MRWVINFFKGIAISIATMIPGVSGGTMAMILNVYDDLIHAVSSFFEDWKKHSKLILELALGGITGVLIFSRLIERDLDKFPVVMSFFFIGVILGGVPLLYKKAISIEKKKINYIYLIVGFLIAMFFSNGPEALKTVAGFNDGVNTLFLILAGIIIAVALILPGISGSFMLLIFGLYDMTLNAINTLNIKFLIPIIIGLLIGTIATAKIIEKLIKRFPGKTYMMILGFVLGSIFAIYPSGAEKINILQSIIALISGIILIYWLSRKESRI